MRRSKEIIFLFALLVVMAAGVLWYVIDRRAKNRAAPPVASRTLAPEPPAVTPPAAPPSPAPEPVPLGGANERKTIDFSTGKGVVKDTPEDRAALEAGLRDIAEATKGVTFEAQKPAEAPKK